MRALLAVIGAAALGAGLLVAAAELRAASRGAPVAPALAATAVCAVVMLGGAALLRGALRGRIAVRRPAPSRPKQR